MNMKNPKIFIMRLCQGLARFFSKYFFVSAGLPWDTATSKLGISTRKNREIEKNSGDTRLEELYNISKARMARTPMMPVRVITT
jgi:hypothetical protein